MATANTTYGASGVTTETSAPTYYGGDDDMLNFWNEMARRRVSGGGGTVRAGNGMRTVRPRNRRHGGEGERMSAGQRTALGALTAQTQALTTPPPLRVVQGAGIIPGQVLDVNAMTGAQRQTFLPGNSAFQNSPGGGPSGPAPRVYGGPGSRFESASDEEDFWRNQALKHQAAAMAQR